MAFADNLQRYRAIKGLNQRDLADDLGISKSTVAAYETGRRMPSFEMLCAIAAYFHVKTDDLVDGADNHSVASQLTDAERRLLQAYREAEPAYQQIAVEILELHRAL